LKKRLPSVTRRRRTPPQLARPEPASIPTLADVARQAGVGLSTVSRVLRNRGSFSGQAQQSVMAATRALNYMPNRIAGTLASMTSDLVGIIVPSVGNAAMPDVLAGALSVLEENGVQSIIGATNFDPLQEESLIEEILSWRPRGILLAGLEHTDRVKNILRKSRTRVVELMDTDGEGIQAVVGFSHRKAGRKSAEHLLEKNYRRIGYVGHSISTDLRAGKRLDGFRSALADSGVTLAAEEVGTRYNSSFEAGRRGLANLLTNGTKLDAVYFSSDNLAIGAYFYCLENGISVPGDLALFGFNGLAISGLIPHPLSTIRSPRNLIGQTGAKLLLEETPQVQVVDLGFELIKGCTS
jgi:LacI family gluconate utilization system Gnt-I transcriptional repressor